MKPPSMKTPKSLAGKIAGTLIQYAKTQLLVVVAVASVAWIILSLLGVRYALPLAIITGSLSIVPFVGFTTAALITGIVAVFDGVFFLSGFHPVFEGLSILVIYFILNQLTDFFLTPYVMGKITKVNPFLIILAVITGTWIFGVVGTILAVPVLLIIKTTVNYYSEK